MLTEKQKRIFDDAFGMNESRFKMYAAVEAVLAEQARAAEQGQDEYTLAQPSPLRYVPSFTTGGTVSAQPPAGQSACKDCGCWVEMGTHCATCFGRNNPFAQPPAGDVLEIESRHSDYGEDAGGYKMLKFGGKYIGRIDNREAADRLLDYVRALAVAREGYVPREQYQMVWDAAQERIEDHKRQLVNMVSLDDVEKAIRATCEQHCVGESMTTAILYHVGLRLAKPAERVTVMRSDFDPFDQVSVWLDGKEECCNLLPLHAERYAAGLREELRDGKEGK